MNRQLITYKPLLPVQTNPTTCVKLDAIGNIQWQKTYGGSGWDTADSVQQTKDGGYIIAGSTDSFGNGKFDAWLVKLDMLGNIQWQKTYGGPTCMDFQIDSHTLERAEESGIK